MDTPDDAKSGSRAVGAEVEMSDALRSIGIADDGIEEPHIEIACNFGLPAGVREIVKNSGNLERPIFAAAVLGSELKALQNGTIALEVEGKLEFSVHRRSSFSRQFAVENQIRGGGGDAVAFGVIASV